MVTCIVLVCVASLALAAALSSCISQPRASLLAADIAKLGFIPGQPVTMPPGFKAERFRVTDYRVTERKDRANFRFADGGYRIDEKGALVMLHLFSPRLNDAGAEPAAITDEQAEIADEAKSAIEIIGPEIPYEERSRISFLTWEQKDIFSLTENELLKTYGPPSETPMGFKRVSSPIIEGVPNYSFDLKRIEYTFQTADNQYWKVVFYVHKELDGKEQVNFISMFQFSPTEKHPLSKLKVYPWPGLYPEPAAK